MLFPLKNSTTVSSGQGFDEIRDSHWTVAVEHRQVQDGVLPVGNILETSKIVGGKTCKNM